MDEGEVTSISIEERVEGSQPCFEVSVLMASWTLEREREAMIIWYVDFLDLQRSWAVKKPSPWLAPGNTGMISCVVRNLKKRALASYQNGFGGNHSAGLKLWMCDLLASVDCCWLSGQRRLKVFDLLESGCQALFIFLRSRILLVTSVRELTRRYRFFRMFTSISGVVSPISRVKATDSSTTHYV